MSRKGISKWSLVPGEEINSRETRSIECFPSKMLGVLIEFYLRSLTGGVSVCLPVVVSDVPVQWNE